MLLQDFEAALSIAEASTVEGDTPLPLDAALTIAQCGAATLDWRTVAEAYDVRALSTRLPGDTGVGTLTVLACYHNSLRYVQYLSLCIHSVLSDMLTLYTVTCDRTVTAIAVLHTNAAIA
jgi:hypothetical protein